MKKTIEESDESKFTLFSIKEYEKRDTGGFKDYELDVDCDRVDLKTVYHLPVSEAPFPASDVAGASGVVEGDLVELITVDNSLVADERGMESDVAGTSGVVEGDLVELITVDNSIVADEPVSESKRTKRSETAKILNLVRGLSLEDIEIVLKGIRGIKKDKRRADRIRMEREGKKVKLPGKDRVASKPWEEAKTIVKEGKEYGPYIYKRWIDEDGIRRSEYLRNGKIDPDPDNMEF